METRAIRNHNPLNIRKGSNWQGEYTPQTDAEFEQFINDAYGFRAAFRIIHNGFKAKPPRDTIRKIISRWAPPADGNDTAAYIAQVAAATGINPDERLTYADNARICSVVAAMAYVESGKNYDSRVVYSGYQLEH